MPQNSDQDPETNVQPTTQLLSSYLLIVVSLRSGKSNPYCELTMGPQCYTSRSIADTLNPKWNFNCQFFIKDLYQDVLCISVLEKDQFSPDGRRLGRQRRSHSFCFQLL